MAEAFSEGSGCKTSSTVDRRGGIRIEMHCVLSCVDTAGLACLRRSFAREGLPVLNCLGGSGALTSSPAAGGCQYRSCFAQPMLGWLLSARDIASALNDGGPGAAAGRLVSVVTSITLHALIVAAVGGRGSFLHLGDCRDSTFQLIPLRRSAPDSTVGCVAALTVSAIRCKGRSRPMLLDHAKLAAQEQAQREAARARCRGKIPQRRSTVAPFLQPSLSVSSAVRPTASSQAFEGLFLRNCCCSLPIRSIVK